MRICYLSDIRSEHTQKWCKYFSEQGYEVHVISLRSGEFKGVKVHSLDVEDGTEHKNKLTGKLAYIKKIKNIRNIINEIKPDILHAHYASSYGLLGALMNYHPFIISMWGSDILLFPKNGPIQKQIIKYNLKKADYIFSTSEYMIKEAKLYTNKEIEHTPFGIDLEIFNSSKINKALNNKEINLGIVKALKEVYGIKYLIEAVKEVKVQNPEYKITLNILGEGPQKEELISLAEKLNILDSIKFYNKRDLRGVADFYRNIDIGVYPSLSESFGVTVLEAQAMGVPVIVSDIDAFKETTIPNETSLICKKKDSESIVKAINKLIKDKNKYEEMSEKAKEFVANNFDEKEIFNNINKLYENILNKTKK